MKKKFRIAFLVLLILAVIALIALYLITHEIAVLEPAGMIGMKERDLFYISSLLMLIVVIPAIVLALVFAWKYREKNKNAKYSPNWAHNSVAEAIWWSVPCVIIIILGVIVWDTSHELNPFKPIESEKQTLTIQVVALEWKWLFIYPEQGIATVNYIQFPENTPIRFEITGDAPMNSFWIPKLGGQIYAMPAMRTELYLIADQVGEYRGYSANISGKGFAGMMFEVQSSSDDAFEAWVKEVKQSPKNLNWKEYLEIVKPSEYVPAIYFGSSEKDLFDRIIMQYAPPK